MTARETFLTTLHNPHDSSREPVPQSSINQVPWSHDSTEYMVLFHRYLIRMFLNRNGRGISILTDWYCCGSNIVASQASLCIFYHALECFSLLIYSFLFTRLKIYQFILNNNFNLILQYYVLKFRIHWVSSHLDLSGCISNDPWFTIIPIQILEGGCLLKFKTIGSSQCPSGSAITNR